MRGRPKKYATREERFWSHIEKREGEGCWLWTGTTDAKGYGMCSVVYGSVRAHRASWLITKGAIPVGLYVCHRCDVRACVRPDHLFVGTQKDNMNDCVNKGRLERSDEWRKNVGLASKGRVKSSETVEKIRIASTGRRLTQEQKEKRRLAVTLSWLKRRERGDHLRLFGRS